jgi:hypothetical protein
MRFALILISLSIFVQCSADKTDNNKISSDQDTTAVNQAKNEKITEVKSPDCGNWIAKETDKVTGDSYLTSKQNLIVSRDGGESGFGIYMLNTTQTKNDIVLSIQAVGAGSCIDEESEINILFTDGSRLKLASQNDFNCDQSATLYFGGVFGKIEQLEQLKSKKIETMRVWTYNDGYVQEDFTNENQQEFSYVVNCLAQ